MPRLAIARPRLVVIVGLLAPLLIWRGTAATVAGPPRVVLGVAYAGDMTLDIHRPARPADAPTVVLLHGCCGDAADLGQLARTLAARGALVLNANWTVLARGGGWPRSYDDARCAVAMARQQAARVGASRNVALVGWSDGALLAASAALAPQPPTTPRRCSAGEETRPDTVVTLGGFLGWPVGPRVRHRTDPSTAGWFGGTPTQKPQAWANGNPYSLAAEEGGEADVAFRLVVGRDDELVDHSRRFARLLRRRGSPVRLHVTSGGHFDVVSPRTSGGSTAVQVVLDVVGRS